MSKTYVIYTDEWAPLTAVSEEEAMHAATQYCKVRVGRQASVCLLIATLKGQAGVAIDRGPTEAPTTETPAATP